MKKTKWSKICEAFNLLGVYNYTYLGLILQNHPWKILFEWVEQGNWVLKFHIWKRDQHHNPSQAKLCLDPTWNCVSSSSVVSPWEMFDHCFLLPQAGEQVGEVDAGCWPCGRILLSSQGFLGSKLAFSSISPFSLPCFSLSPASSSFSIWRQGSVNILVGRYFSGFFFPRNIFMKPCTFWLCLSSLWTVTVTSSGLLSL